MIIVWSTGIYPAINVEYYGLAVLENWQGGEVEPPINALVSRLLMGVGV